MPLEIVDIAARDTRVIISVIDRATGNKESEISLSATNAEIWASELQDAARKVDRSVLENTVAALRRTAEQVNAQLRAAELQLLRSTDASGAAPGIPNGAVVMTATGKDTTIPVYRSGPPSPRIGGITIMPEVSE